MLPLYFAFKKALRRYKQDNVSHVVNAIGTPTPLSTPDVALLPTWNTPSHFPTAHLNLIVLNAMQARDISGLKSRNGMRCFSPMWNPKSTFIVWHNRIVWLTCEFLPKLSLRIKYVSIKHHFWIRSVTDLWGWWVLVIYWTFWKKSGLVDGWMDNWGNECNQKRNSFCNFIISLKIILSCNNVQNNGHLLLLLLCQSISSLKKHQSNTAFNKVPKYDVAKFAFIRILQIIPKSCL